MVEEGAGDEQRREKNLWASKVGPPEDFSSVILVIFQLVSPWITVEEVVQSLVCIHRKAYGQSWREMRQRGGFAR